ncbi:MAG: DNA cytosine methyltransferase [Aggregatibacter sp.]|uniref:DNA cytosine methyltransferase n=1 Tax=Aggregatibacter sp. TaxID=1872413 RepID=UPI0036201154
MKFTFGSVCSGIEAVSVAWGDFAKPLWFSEIEPFPSAVLAHHYPNVPNLGDMRTLPERIINREIPAPDVLVGGTPCQAFSVAGKRESLNDNRGNLTLVLIEILEAIDYVREKDGKAPCILVWENVPGVLSTKDNAFGCLVGRLAGAFEPLQPPRGKWTGAGYVHSEMRNIAWRILNAKYFGVPQSRRRIFLVAGAGTCNAAEILFESQSLCGDIETQSKEQQKTAGTSKSGVRSYRRARCDKYYETSIASTQTAHIAKEHNDLVLFDIAERRDGARIYGDITPTLTAKMGTGGNNVPCVRTKQILRKLTPVECERLQGFTDNYTRVPFNGKSAEKCPDSHRYKAIGNSMAVPVMRWIGGRLFITNKE